ncbi:hypothetical protein [uncultured Pelagimonas sp.]|uniref:hypothetical protein n=1 Tax=uncultured Pelagimonas sp. TaxID=1618102 RepID=UPI002625A94A|nr:hypothetical protein [uncultured Pelagimonas sp.]
MATSTPTEVLLGCDPQVRVTIIEDDGNLFMRVVTENPETTDLDGLFFNLADDVDASALTIYPDFDENVGSNGENVTGYTVASGTMNQLDNGAQIQEPYDVRLEFGTVPWTSGGDVDEATLTFYIDGGDSNLTADSIDLSNLTAVVNSDNGAGLALTGGTGNSGDDTTTVYETVTAIDEDMDDIAAGCGRGQTNDNVVENDFKAVYGELMTNGYWDGDLQLAAVESDGPVTFSFDARANNTEAFENSGRYADSLEVQVRLDNGEWQTLDTFMVNDAGTALVGDQSGQTFGSDGSTLTYSGGVLDNVDGTAEFRIVSDISACNEKIFLDDIQVTTTEAVDVPSTGDSSVMVTALSEDFVGDDTPESSDAIVHSDRWNVEQEALFTNGHNDGRVELAEVATDGPVEFSLDAQAVNIDSFENSGHYADSLRVEAQIDGGDWVLLDEFRVNDAGTAMVGDQTGQTFDGDMTTLNYSGGVLDGASENVQFRLVSDISANNEILRVDNLEVRVTETTDGEHADETCEGFDGAASGDTAALQFDGFSVTAQRAGDDAASENDAMIFDTANPTGGDSDLAYDDQGNAIIISEDNDASDADDNAGGGTITFDFDVPSDVVSLNVLDVEEDGGSIDLFDAEGELLDSVAIPGIGDNSLQTIDISVDGVSSMQVNLAGSGAVDDLCYATPDDMGADCGQYLVTYDDLMKDPDPLDPNDEADDADPAADPASAADDYI